MKLRRTLYQRTHTDYKGVLPSGSHGILMLDRKTGGTVLAEVELVNDFVAREECEHPFLRTTTTEEGRVERLSLVCENCCTSMRVQPWDSHDYRVRTFLTLYPPASERAATPEA